MQKKMTIEIRNETPAFNESFVSTIELPALPLALRDAEQRARLLIRLRKSSLSHAQISLSYWNAGWTIRLLRR